MHQGGNHRIGKWSASTYIFKVASTEYWMRSTEDREKSMMAPKFLS